MSQVADESERLAWKLREAMIRAGFVHEGKPSARALALKLAGDKAGDRRVVDDYRKQVRRWLSGGQQGVQQKTARMLAEALGTPESYWPLSRAEPQTRLPVVYAEELLRLLDAGEAVDPDRLARLAARLEEIAQLNLRLAARLREGAAAARSGR